MSLTFLCGQTLFAQDQEQDQRTITVEGTKTYNLSPNEVVIEIEYEEYYVGNDKVTLESLEKQIVNVLGSEKIKSDKITFGSVAVIRPYNYESKKYEKPRLKKSLFVCLDDSDQYSSLTRSLEKKDLFEKVIKNFGISELRHTEKSSYLEKSRNEAFLDAKSKADLILSNSSQKTGKIIKIEEKRYGLDSSPRGGFYSTDNTNESENSGFKPIVVSYAIIVTFEILE